MSFSIKSHLFATSHFPLNACSSPGPSPESCGVYFMVVSDLRWIAPLLRTHFKELGMLKRIEFHFIHVPLLVFYLWEYARYARGYGPRLGGAMA